MTSQITWYGFGNAAVKNFQVSKALVVAAEKIPLNVPNHRLRLEVCVYLAVD